MSPSSPGPSFLRSGTRLALLALPLALLACENASTPGATRARAAPLSSVTDFSTMEHKLDTNQYTDTDVFLDDAQLVFDNCRAYNPEDTVYHKCAVKLERYMRERMKEYGIVRSSKVKREHD